MTITIDPEETETRILLDFTGDLSRKSVLEIGSGDGRLTWRFASQVGRVVGLEPDQEKYNRAIQELPANLEEKVEFLNQRLEDYAAGRDSSILPIVFDRVLLSWSL